MAMNDELKSIKKLAKDATKLLAVSFLIELVANFEHRAYSRAGYFTIAVILRLIALVMYALCIYKFLVYKNIIK